MNPEINAKLIEINRQFYQQFAPQFDATRRRLQPGVSRIIRQTDRSTRILDLGCGNGELRRALLDMGHQAAYTGLDFSEELLAIAREGNLDPHSQFLKGDLSQEYWQSGIKGPFETIFAFAVFHHLPPANLLALLDTLKTINRGQPFQLTFSCWQFLNSPDWRARIQDWEKVGLKADEVGQSDFLLDWRRGGKGYRYVHLYDEGQLDSLAARAGYTIIESFSSDGKEGNLGFYQTWKTTNRPAL